MASEQDEPVLTSDALNEVMRAFEAAYSSMALLKVLQSDDELTPEFSEAVIVESRVLLNYVLNHWSELLPAAQEYAVSVIEGLASGDG